MSGLMLAAASVLPTAASGGYLLQEDWSTGSGTTPPSGWTTTGGTWNFSNTIPSLPQGGNNVSVVAFTPEYVWKSFTAQAVEVWAYCQFQITSLAIGSAEVIFALQDSGNVDRCYVKLNTDGTLQIWDSQSEATSTSAALSANTSYHIWLHYKAGSGTGQIDVGFSTTGTRPTIGTAFASVPNTAETATVSKIALWTNDASLTQYFDHVLVSTTQIGNSP